MKKSRLVNLFLLLISISLTFFTAEYILRKLLFMDNEQFESLRNPAFYAIYPQDQNEDFYNEDYWNLNYLFNRSFDLKEPNPLLGWTGFFNRETYSHWYDDTTGIRRPVLLFGDSFAMCIDSVECFDEYLNSDTLFSDSNVLYNYGVGGYGVDQIQLLMKEVLPKYENPFVVFSMLTTDLDRSVLKVRDAQKPHYRIIKDKLLLEGTPITLTSSEFFDQNPPEISSYIYNRAYNIISRRLDLNQSDKAQTVENIKNLNKLILDKAISHLKSKNIEFVILIFQPETHRINDWRLSFLRDYCIDNDVPYICDVDIKNEHKLENNTTSSDYYILGDGHPSSLANQLVSAEIKSCIIDSNYMQTLYRNQLPYKENLHLREVASLKSHIIRDDIWLDAIRNKAIKKEISIDSMLTLDAEYMIELNQKQ